EQVGERVLERLAEQLLEPVAVKRVGGRDAVGVLAGGLELQRAAPGVVDLGLETRLEEREDLFLILGRQRHHGWIPWRIDLNTPLDRYATTTITARRMIR